MADSLFGKGIPLGMNFDLGAEQALDARTVVNTYAELDSHVQSGRAYPGLTVYVIDEDKKYRWTGSEWKKDGGSGSANFIVATYQDIDGIRSEDPIKGSLIYVESDSNKANEANMYIVTEEARNEDRLYYPAKYVAMSTFAKSQVPVLAYDESMPEGVKIYKTRDDNVILRFSFTSDNYGDGKYRIYKDGSLLKAWSAPKGVVIAEIGKITTNGQYELTVTAEDYFGIPSNPKEIKFQVIVGGLEVSSSFDETLLSAIYEVGDEIIFPYSANISDREQTIKMQYTLTGPSGTQTFVVDTGMANISSTWTVQGITLRGNYKLEVQGYTGESINDTTEGVFLSNKLSYEFIVLAKNEIGMLGGLEKTPDSNSYVSIPFKVFSKVDTYFIVTGTLYQKNQAGTWIEYKSNPEGVRVARNVSSYWSVGKLPVGTYKYRLDAYNSDRTIMSLTPLTGEFTVSASSYTSMQPVKTNLIAWFDANDRRNTDNDRNIWYNKESLGDTYRIELHNLNYVSNGWKHAKGLDDTAEGEFMLKFSGDSYGVMTQVHGGGITEKYSPFSVFKTAGQQGLTIETAFRTRCVGELNTRVMTCMEKLSLNTPGIAITYDKLYINSDKQVTNLDFMEDEWIHVAFVIDKSIRILGSNEEEYKKQYPDRDYQIIGQDNIENLNQTYSIRIYINGVLCACSAFIDDEFLDKAGKAFPLVLNSTYDEDTDSFENFGECELKFLRVYNGYLTSEDILQNYIAHIYDTSEQQAMKDRNDTSIVSLPKVVFKRITDPTMNGNNKTTFDNLHAITDKKESKKTCVPCVLEYHEIDGTITQIENVDVYLQGTSSLQYPVKNYQIKCYNSPSDNPDRKKQKIFVPGKENEWKTDCYTYTLKVDFMEQSHNNNTPTAVFYSQVVKELTGNDPSKVSPARRDGYLDAIDGIPCIVYYNNDPQNEGDVLVGSFMFNVHKDGDQLGFECEMYDDDGNSLGECETCVSYEATANSSDTAGCFFTMEESIHNVYKYKVDEWYEAYLKSTNQTQMQLSREQFQAMIDAGEVEDTEEIDYMTFEEFRESYSIYDYIGADFEPRYAYNEDDNEAMYRPMIDLVNWVSSCYPEGKLDKTKFEKEFDEHLSFEYCMAYFLQMMMFAQIDNCGKNSMFDTWDGKKFYPRPYDMDSQMGLSNTGTETIEAHAEILEILSPYQATGDLASYSNTDNVSATRYMSYNTKTNRLWNAFSQTFASKISEAYIQLRSSGVYSVENITKTIFGMTIDAIGEIYYNKDAASKYLAQTTDGKTEYLKALHGNRAQKYKKFLTDRMLFLDSIYGYYKSSNQTDTLNSEMSLRSDATVTETVKCQIGISVYSPMYIKVSVGSGMDAIVMAYVGPKSTYVDPDTGATKEGTLFSFPIKASDKEVIIYGAGNIKEINRLETLNVRDLVIGEAEKIIELNLSSSSRMTGLALGNNKFLRNLDCSYSYSLGDNGKELNLSNCLNLRTVNLSYTNLNAVSFPANANLKDVNLTACKLKSVNIQGAEFLTKVNISNCVNIDGFTINNCPKMETIDVSGTSTKAFTATNCENLTTVTAKNCNLMQSFDLTNSNKVYKIDLSHNSSPVMANLSLYTVYSLRELYLNNSGTLKTLRLPLYLNDEEAQKAANGQASTAKKWEVLEVLNIASSSINKIQYGGADVEGTKLDMTQLKNLTTLNLGSCTSITEIYNINHAAGNFNSKFAGCSSLAKISGILKTSGTSATNIFSGCKALGDINSLSFNFTNMQNLSSAFYQCSKATTAMVKKLLDASGTSLTNVSSMCSMYSAGGTTFGTTNDRKNRDLPSNLFENTPNITNMSSMFAYCPYQKVPGDLLNPVAAKIQNVSGMFSWASSLTDVGNEFLKNKPALTNVNNLFCSQSNLVNYVNEDPDIFSGSPNITDTSNLFYDCQKLICYDLGNMMKPLTRLTTCKNMFYNCKAFVCELPEGFLSANTQITSINNMFRACSGLTTLPRSIFRENAGDTNVNFNSLTSAIGTFGGCSNLEGVVSSTFFDGCPNLRDMGGKPIDYVPGSNSYWADCGFFEGCNKITGYHETIFKNLPNMTSCSRFFYKSSANANLETCFYYDDSGQESQYYNSISPNLFKHNPALTNTAYMFANNTGLVGQIPANLFDTNRSVLISATGMFKGCTGMTGRDLDGDLGLVGLSKELFKNCTSLQSVNEFLQGASNFTMTIPEDLFLGCSILKNVANMFNGCKSLTGGLSVKLFDSCRDTLENVSGMFNGSLLSGAFPEGDYEDVLQVISYELCLSTDPEALQVQAQGSVTDPYTQIGYNQVINLNPGLIGLITQDGLSYVKPRKDYVKRAIRLGLLSDCKNLTTTESMFSSCTNFGYGGIVPSDLFFSSDSSRKFTKLTSTASMFYNCGFNQAYVDPVTEIKYIFNKDLFVNCPALTTTAGMFNYCERIPACELHTASFDKQTKLQSTANMFLRVYNLTGIVNQALLRNSIGTLTDTRCMFGHCNMSEIASGFLNLGSPNTKLKYMRAMFYSNDNLTGSAPAFWDKALFTAIEESQNGYYGAFCTTNITNKDQAEKKSANWTIAQTI